MQLQSARIFTAKRLNAEPLESPRKQNAVEISFCFNKSPFYKTARPGPALKPSEPIALPVAKAETIL